MARYIDADIAFEEITDFAGQAVTKSAYGAFWKAAKSVKKQPIADVRPVVRGEWIPCGDGDNVPSMCSHCCKVSQFKSPYDFCPNCGADMREQEEK